MVSKVGLAMKEAQGRQVWTGRRHLWVEVLCGPLRLLQQLGFRGCGLLNGRQVRVGTRILVEVDSECRLCSHLTGYLVFETPGPAW